MSNELYGHADCTVTLEIEVTGVPVLPDDSYGDIEDRAILEATCSKGDRIAGDVVPAKREDVTDAHVDNIDKVEDDG